MIISWRKKSSESWQDFKSWERSHVNTLTDTHILAHTFSHHPKSWHFLKQWCSNNKCIFAVQQNLKSITCPQPFWVSVIPNSVQNSTSKPIKYLPVRFQPQSSEREHRKTGTAELWGRDKHENSLGSIARVSSDQPLRQWWVHKG